jgi:bifunctional DNA-binding transcriptional regulator/antitoxin component of YhaV-PrlF toxin-antitoxin module
MILLVGSKLSGNPYIFGWIKLVLVMRTAAKGSGRVGQKGELFPPKEVREEAGLKPGDQVVYKADHGRIEVVKIPGLREAFSRRKTAKITFDEFENMTGEVLSE